MLFFGIRSERGTADSSTAVFLRPTDSEQNMRFMHIALLRELLFLPTAFDNYKKSASEARAETNVPKKNRARVPDCE